MKHTHATYTCDRCRLDLGDKAPCHPLKPHISASFDYPEGPGARFVWTDLCVGCYREVAAFFGVKL